MVKVGPDHNDKDTGLELQGTTGVEDWLTVGDYVSSTAEHINLHSGTHLSLVEPPTLQHTVSIRSTACPCGANCCYSAVTA